ncbi:unnamed protein product [Rotaria sp. Silwood2]|nr:unnamed protein product [Rotaria sp. Silwood2]CAF2870097.1 unnamed protein product [Rotaria sp. Silwood2]CAF4144681.1 unnamed protein product [Rotaria sp. Silwood2]CAF4358490.1 unnamed protein product [Rotaria sp. Silwood2]
MTNNKQYQNNGTRNNESYRQNECTNSTNSMNLNNQSTEYYDHHTDTRYIHHSNIHNRIPPPDPHTLRSATPRRARNEYDDDDEFTVIKSKRRRNQNNIKNNCHYDLVQDVQPNVVVNSPTTTHQLQQMSQPIVPTVSTEATRYAQTRFPFSPFIIRFNSGNIKESHAAEQIIKHFYDNVKIDVNIANIRKSIAKCQGDDYDLLIYVKDVDSFSALFGKQNWPQQIGGQTFTFTSMPSFPPQLSVIMKNVDLRVDLNELSEELNSLYPEIHNIIRLKNKYQNDIKMIKIEILSSSKRDALLKDGKIRVLGMTFDIEEYLCPATVLICSKCQGIGHFRRQCKQQNDTCKTCGTNCTDIRQHRCTSIMHCIHCMKNDHPSNSLKCPIVKEYRSLLTKKLLSTSTMNITNKNNYSYEPAGFPALPQPQSSTAPISINNATSNKIDELIFSVAKMNDTLDRIEKKQKEFELFIVESKKNDDYLFAKVDELMMNNREVKDRSDSNEKLIKKLILPSLDLLSQFLQHINLKATGIDDADFKYKIQTVRAQLDNASKGKIFS